MVRNCEGAGRAAPTRAATKFDLICGQIECRARRGRARGHQTEWTRTRLLSLEESLAGKSFYVDIDFYFDCNLKFVQENEVKVSRFED